MRLQFSQLLDNVLARFRQQPSFSTFYVLGHWAAFLGFALVFVAPKSIAPASLLLFGASLLSIATGFAWWLAPHTERVWGTTAGKVVISLAHLLVLFASTILARVLVASATGLPPQDFELAIYALTLLWYPAVWAIAAAILLALVGAAGIAMDTLRSSVPIPRSAVSKTQGDHALGAMSLAVVTLLLISFLAPTSDVQNKLVRRIVYLTEYFPVQRYPGINQGEQAHLHENGVVSSASMKDGDVVITTRTLELP